MGRGGSSARIPLPTERQGRVEKAQYTYLPRIGSPAYSVRGRIDGMAHPLTVHMVDRAWGATVGGRWVHTPFEDPCPCGEGERCSARRVIGLAKMAGFTMPYEARMMRTYKYRLTASGLVVAFAGVPGEGPMFIATLTEDITVVVLTNGVLRDAVVIAGTCSVCRTDDCAHTEAAEHAHGKPASLVRPSTVGPDVLPGVIAFGEVERYPDLGYVFAATLDWRERKEQLRAMERAQAEAEAEEQRQLRELLIEEVRREKEAKGEKFDPSEYKESADEEPAEQAPDEWARTDDPDEGYILMIASANGPAVMQPLRDPERCACAAAPGCAHEALIARIVAAPIVDRESRADQVSREAAEANQQQSGKPASLPSGATGGQP